MLAFLPAPDPLPRPPRPERRTWRTVLLLSAAAAAIASMRPWIEVQFHRLFGAVSGPPGWQSTAGFTCLCTSLLVAVMALAETQHRATHQAVRPGSLLLVVISALALALEWWDGPGQIRGVSASWTAAFWLLATAVPLLLLACSRRCAALSRPAGGASADYSSSGPPT